MNVIQDIFIRLFPIQFPKARNFFSFLLIALAIIAALIALAFALWHIKGLNEDREFIITLDSLGEQSEKICEILNRMKVSKREKSYAILL